VKPRFQADADLHAEIVAGVLRREPAVDFQSAQERLGERMADSDVLALAATEGRILVSHDVNTIPFHFRRFVAEGNLSPGVLLIPQSLRVSRAIDELLLIWSASEAADWQDLLVWLPL
jgi:hypothetical protein